MNCSLAARLLVLATLSAPCTAVVAQEASLGAVISGARVPLTVKASDLSDAYHAVRISIGTGSDPLAAMAPLMSMGGGPNDALHSELLKILEDSWTDGTVIGVEGGRFLVTYKLDLNVADLMSRTENGSKALPTGILKLNLIRVDAIRSIESQPALTRERLLRILGIEKGSPGREAPAQPEDRSRSMSNLKQVALGMAMYATDYDDVLPYAQGTKAVQYVTAPYLKSMKLWETYNPNGSEFLFNTALGGVSIVQTESPAETVLFYESKAWPDGKRSVAFVDGHVQVVDERTWQSLKKWLVRRYKAKGKPLPMNYGQNWNPPGTPSER